MRIDIYYNLHEYETIIFWYTKIFCKILRLLATQAFYFHGFQLSSRKNLLLAVETWQSESQKCLNSCYLNQSRQKHFLHIMSKGKRNKIILIYARQYDKWTSKILVDEYIYSGKNIFVISCDFAFNFLVTNFNI